MDERRRRIGSNEAVFRAVNEEIESLNRDLAEISDRTMHIVCECGKLTCSEQLSVPVTEYEDVRSDPALFLIVPGHEIPDTEDVVERTTRYSVVRKHAGGPERLAARTDPRSEAGGGAAGV
jgi:hypothetical protein